MKGTLKTHVLGRPASAATGLACGAPGLPAEATTATLSLPPKLRRRPCPRWATSPSATDTTAPYAGLAGTIFSVDFNPVAHRLRVLSDTGQNLRIDVQNGATITDGDVNLAAAATLVAGAYTNSFAGTTATTLFDLDAAADVPATQSLGSRRLARRPGRVSSGSAVPVFW